MPRNLHLNEAITVDGASYLGTGHGYDLFDITTYAAAQEFKVEDTNQEAGRAYVQNEQTFNNNINETQKLYFFARENTNKVYGAIVHGPNTQGSVTFIGTNRNEITASCNFMFENAGDNSSKTYYDKPLPFYLIPTASINDQHGEDDYERCLIVEEGVIKAALKQFYPHEGYLELANLSTDIIGIDSNAFNFGLTVNLIRLKNNITYIGANALSTITDTIQVDMFEKPDGWDNAWNAGKEAVTLWGFDASPEARAAHEQDIIAQAEAAAERLRREEEERRRAEEEELRRREAEERRKREEALGKLRYKVKGNEVVITGIRGATPSKLIVPDQIENKKVTTIGAYAFFDEEELSELLLPSTLIKIEQGALSGTSIRRIRVSKDCIVGKYNYNNALGGNIAIYRS